jgi:hypothetical protein
MIHIIATPNVMTAYMTKMIMKVSVVRINWLQNTIKTTIAIERPTPIINGVQSFFDHARDIGDTFEVNSNLLTVQHQLKIIRMKFPGRNFDCSDRLTNRS